MHFTIRWLWCIALACLAASGCSRQDPLYIAGGDDAPVSSVYLEVTPALAQVNVATSQAYQAWRVDPAAGSRVEVTDEVLWAVADGAVASIDSSGRASGVSPGTTGISASLDALTASASLVVSGAVLLELSVLPLEQAALVGMNRSFSAVARYDDGRVQDVSADVVWASSNGAVASVDSGGVASSLSQGSSTISATLQGVPGTASLVVLNATPVAFSVNPAQASLPVGSSELFTANVLLSSGENLDVTEQVVWSTSAAAIAAVDNQSGDKGLVTAINSGSAEIIASASFAGTTVADSASVTVTAPTLDALQVTPAGISIPAGTRGGLTATAYYSDNTTRDVTKDALWQSSDGAVVFVEASGNLAGQGQALSEGSAVVSARFAGLTAQADISVTAATLTALQITPLLTSVSAGTPVQYYASGFYSDGSSHDLTQTVNWQSSNSAIAAISTTGMASTQSAGTITISALLEGLQADASLTVTSASVVSIEVGPVAASIQAGSALAYGATAIYSNDTRRDITTLAYWQSSDEATGVLLRNGVAKGLSAGTTVISADYGGQRGVAALRVTQATLDALLVIPQSIQLQTGTLQQYSAVGIFSDHIEDLTEQASWAVSDTTLASISNSVGTKGVVTTVAPGSVTVTATYTTESATATLIIAEPQIVALAVSCDESALIVGYSTQCEAIATYSDGHAQDVTLESSWVSSDSGVARVENLARAANPGKVTAIGAGTANITATIAGLSDSEAVTVDAVVLVSIDVSSNRNLLVEGDQEQFFASGQFSNGSSADLTATALWQTADSGVLTVSNVTGAEGLAAAVAAGTTTVSATQDGVTGTSAVITVQAAPPTDNVRKVEILCLGGEYTGPIEIKVGDVDRCKAYAINKDDTVDDVTALTSWSVDDPANLSIVGLTADSQYLEVLGEQRGNTILRADYFKKAVINYKVH